MSTDPLHRLARETAARWSGITPLGLPCVEHSSTTVDGQCYFHIPGLSQPTREQRIFVGLEDPFITWPEYIEAHRGWVTASSWMLEHLRRTDEDLGQYDEPSDDLKIVLSVGTTRRLEEIEA